MNLIFDFDGTLADTSRGIIETEYVMQDRMGLPRSTDERIRSAIGLPLRESLRVGGLIPEELLDEAVPLYRELFNEVAPQYITMFPGVVETLNELSKRCPLALATSRSHQSLDMILETHKMDRMFVTMVTGDSTLPPKPNPDYVLHILEEQGWDASQTLVVGDTTFDLEMGKGAGCRTVGVTYGNHSRDQLLAVSPWKIIDRFPELSPLI